MKAPFLIGRMLFGGFFLYAGINHLRNFKSMAPYAESKGVPAPKASVALAGAAISLMGVEVPIGRPSLLERARRKLAA